MKVKGRVVYLAEGVEYGLGMLAEHNLRFCHYHKCLDALPVYKMVHDVCPHVRSVEIQVKKGMIVSHRECPLNGKGVSDSGFGFLFVR